MEQALALPVAEPKCDDQRRTADDQPGAQLVQVVHDAESVFGPDRPEDPRPRHDVRVLDAVRGHGLELHAHC